MVNHKLLLVHLREFGFDCVTWDGLLPTLLTGDRALASMQHSQKRQQWTLECPGLCAWSPVILTFCQQSPAQL